MFKQFATALICALTLAFTTACTSLQPVDGQSQEANTQSLAAKSAIQYATIKAIEGKSERAKRVVSITADLDSLVDGNTQASVDKVEQLVRDEVRWDKLDTADTLLVNNLINGVKVQLQKRIDEGVLDKDERVAVRTVLTWVREAAKIAKAQG
jgi:hypothetical protein